MTIALLGAYTTFFTVVALVYVPIMLWIELRVGVNSLEEFVNYHFSSRKTAALFQIVAYGGVCAWVIFALPLILYSLSSTRIDENTIYTFLGDIPRRYGDLYFIMMFVNILGAKAAMKMGDMAGLLKMGPVTVKKQGILLVWAPRR